MTEKYAQVTIKYRTGADPEHPKLMLAALDALTDIAKNVKGVSAVVDVKFIDSKVVSKGDSYYLYRGMLT